MITMASLVFGALMIAGDPLKEPAPKDFPKFLDQCVAAFKKKELNNVEKWAINSTKQYRLDREKRVVTLVGDKRVTASFQLIATYNTENRTWLWSWANDTVEEKLRVDASKLKKYGETNRIEQLTKEGWEGDFSEVAKMTALAVHLLDAEGAVLLPNGKLRLVVVVRNIQLASEK